MLAVKLDKLLHKLLMVVLHLFNRVGENFVGADNAQPHAEQQDVPSFEPPLILSCLHQLCQWL